MARIASSNLVPYSKLRRIGAAALCLSALILPISLHAWEDRPISRKVSPVYPELAKRMRITGVVKVAATVAPDGSVTGTKIVSGNHMLSGAAEEAVQKWKFTSAPSQSTEEVEINFTISQ